jgi:hypothetical protein
MGRIRILSPDALLRTLLSLSRVYATRFRLPKTFGRILSALGRNVARTTSVRISQPIYLDAKAAWLLDQGKRAQAKPYLERRLKFPFSDVVVEALHVGILARVLYKLDPKDRKVARLYRTYLVRLGNKAGRMGGRSVTASFGLLNSWLNLKCPISASDKQVIVWVLERCSMSLRSDPPIHIRNNVGRWINFLRRAAKKLRSTGHN